MLASVMERPRNGDKKFVLGDAVRKQSEKDRSFWAIRRCDCAIPTYAGS